MADRLGNITLNGLTYRVDMNSGMYKGRDITDFAPKATTPGGSAVFSDLSLYQTLTISDWKHGFGFPWHTDESGFYFSNKICTWVSGQLQRNTRVEIKTTAQSSLGLYGGIAKTHLPNTLLLWNNTLVYKYTTNNNILTKITDTDIDTKTIVAVWQNGTNTFVAISGDHVFYSSDLITWTVCNANANAKDYAWIVSHDGYVFAGKKGVNEVYYDSTVDLHTLYGDKVSDPTVITVGPPGVGTINAISYNGQLLIFRPDAVYRLDTDMKTARKVLDYSDEVDEFVNFQSVVIYNGNLIFSVQHKVYSWNGQRTQDITPPRIDDIYPYNYITDYGKFMPVGNFLYVPVTDVYETGHILLYDGSSWHNFQDVSVNNLNAILFDNHTKAFYWDNPGIAYETILAVYTESPSDRPLSRYDPSDTTCYWISSKLDMGYRNISKSTPSIMLEVENCKVGTRYILVDYKRDTDTTWQPWGGTNLVTNKIDTNGQITITNPDVSSTIEYKWIQFRLTFITDNDDSSSQTPILRSFNLRMIMRPDTSYGYSFIVIGEYQTSVGVGIGDDRRPLDIMNDLRTARDSKSPVEYIDPYGVTHTVYVTSVTETNGETLMEGEMGASPNIEQRIQLNLVEMT